MLEREAVGLALIGILVVVLVAGCTQPSKKRGEGLITKSKEEMLPEKIEGWELKVQRVYAEGRVMFKRNVSGGNEELEFYVDKFNSTKAAKDNYLKRRKLEKERYVYLCSVGDQCYGYFLNSDDWITFRKKNVVASVNLGSNWVRTVEKKDVLPYASLLHKRIVS